MKSGSRFGRIRVLAGVAGAGAVSWLIDVGLFWTLVTHVGMDRSSAGALAFAVSGLVNFVLNRSVFSHPDMPRTGTQVRRYLVLFAVNTAITATLIPIAVDLVAHFGGDANVSLILGKVLVTALVLPINAFFYHIWVFAGRAKASNREVDQANTSETDSQ